GVGLREHVPFAVEHVGPIADVELLLAEEEPVEAMVGRGLALRDRVADAVGAGLGAEREAGRPPRLAARRGDALAVRARVLPAAAGLAAGEPPHRDHRRALLVVEERPLAVAVALVHRAERGEAPARVEEPPRALGQAAHERALGELRAVEADAL